MSKHMNAEQKAKWCVANNCALEDFSTAYKARSEMLAGFDAAHYDVPRPLLKKWHKERARKAHYVRQLSPGHRQDQHNTRKERGLKLAKKGGTNMQPSPFGYSWERGHG